MNKTHFDLEQDIFKAWNVTDDIDLVYQFVMDSNMDAALKDNISNLLLGISSIYNLKFQSMMDTYTELTENRKFSN